MSIKGWLDKENVVYTDSGISFSFKKGELVTCYHMDKPQGHYAMSNKPDTKGQMLYESTHMRYLSIAFKIRETESRKMVAKGWEEGKSVFNGHQVSIVQDEKALEIYGTTM